jgi:hypothetical protein
MSKDFYLAARYQMPTPDASIAPAGGTIFPVGIPYHTLARRNLDKDYPHLARRLLDPQLYLATLNAAAAKRSCANLASYPWFSATPEPFDSEKQTQAKWKQETMNAIHETWRGALPTEAERPASLSACVSIQRDLGCEAVIIPAPMTADPAGDYDTELAWLDEGFEIARKLAPAIPRWATVAISDTCLRGVEPYSNRLLDVIVDQLTAREFDGAYLVIEQASENGYYCTHPNTVGALLRLADAFHTGGLRVTVSYAGMAGLLALSAGADAWSTGWYRGERRLKESDLEDDTGRATPTFYSHPLASEIHLDKDLDRIVKAGFLKQIEDVTPASDLLMRALREGKPTKAVTEWEYRLGNVSAAKTHLQIAGARETRALQGMQPADLVDHTRRWLANAEGLAVDLYKIGSPHVRTELKHQAGWRKAFEIYIQNRDG